MLRGTRVANAHVALSVDGSNINEEIVDAVEDAGPGVAKAGDEHGEVYGDHLSDGFRERMSARLPQIAARLRERLGIAGAQAGEEAGDEAGKSLSTRLLDRTKDLGEKISEELGDRLASRSESVRKGIETAFSDDFAERLATRFADRIGETVGDRFELHLASALDDAEGLMAEFVSRNQGSIGSRGGGASEVSFADRIGKMFGSGSRNNALNLLGKSLTNIINLSTSLSGKITQLTGVGGSGSSMFSQLAVSGSASAAALGIVAAVMAVLVTVAGGLLGILTALVATVTSGLIGGLLVAGGALTAAAAAAGLLTVAFTSMTDAQREFLGSTFQPLKAELTGIGQLMITQMIPYFETWSTNLQESLLLIAPLADAMGDAFGRAGADITAALSGPGFKILIAMLTQYLPSITTSLSRALGGFLNGLAGTFGAIMPLVLRFSQYLERVANRFSEWANSAQGQNAIVDFANRAVTSLQSLWNFVRELGGLLADVLFSPQAQNAGNTMFDGLADALARVRKSISSGDLEKWFSDALEFGGALWKLMGSLGDTLIALYNSGVLEAIGQNIETLATVFDNVNAILGPFIDAVGWGLPTAMAAAATPILALMAAVIGVGEAIEAVGGLFGLGDGGELDHVKDSLSQIKDLWTGLGGSSGSSSDPFANLVDAANDAVAGVGASVNAGLGAANPFTLPSLITSGNNALAQTDQEHGGTKPDKPKYQNPYLDFANSLIQQAPTVAEQMRKAMRQLNKAVAGAISEASAAVGGDAVADLLGSQVDNLKATGNSMVESARSALSASAERLAAATSKKDARKALKEVKAGQRALAAAIAAQEKINAAAKILSAQEVVSGNNVEALLSGFSVYNVTLADYAEARARVAESLEAANQQLADAIAMRDNYSAQVSEGLRSFGAIVTAQAKTLGGIEQALTAGDITDNLRDRLAKIQKFNEQLNVLLSQGLSNEAYKQLVDAGVEQGGAYVEALVNGGQGSVAEVNELTEQIAQAAGALGQQASDRLYAAGVSAAQGLVDGLTSLSGQLDAAATSLGNQIAAAVKAALGIASPSTLMFDYMYNGVGDGVVNGLDAAGDKVANAAARLSGRVAISPSLAEAYAEGRVPRGVDGGTGNTPDPRYRDLHIHTPTENPVAVAQEVLNETVGRLP